MHILIVVPGIMGTRLVLRGRDGTQDEEVWPPTWDEVGLWGYKRIDKLKRGDLEATTLIDHVCGVEFYRPLLKLVGQCGFQEDGIEKRLLAFSYDWRRELSITAASLAARLDDEAREAEQITILAHSMGGLVARILLESGDYDQRPWFAKIKRFIAVAVPHNGAPLALARVMGMDKAMGISKEHFKEFSEVSKFPSGYQLLPAPGELACWNQSSRDLDALDIYDPRVAEALGLDSGQLTHTKKLHQLLDETRRPAHVRTVFVGASGHRTPTRLNLFFNNDGVDRERSVLTMGKDSGDGTVPLFSAMPTRGQRVPVIQKHATAFDARPFRLFLRRIIGDYMGPVTVDLQEDGQAEPYGLSLPDLVLSVSDPVEVTIIPPASVQAELQTLSLQVEEIDPATRTPLAIVETYPLRYQGPPLQALQVTLPALPRAAIYRFRLFLNEEEQEATTAVFGL